MDEMEWLIVVDWVPLGWGCVALGGMGLDGVGWSWTDLDLMELTLASICQKIGRRQWSISPMRSGWNGSDQG